MKKRGCLHFQECKQQGQLEPSLADATLQAIEPTQSKIIIPAV